MKCSRCPEIAFLRVDRDTVLCADCWLVISPPEPALSGLPATGADKAPFFITSKNATTFAVAARSSIQES